MKQIDDTYKCNQKSDAVVVEKFRKVSGTVWVRFESCDYREDNKRGMNE